MTGNSISVASAPMAVPKPVRPNGGLAPDQKAAVILRLLLKEADPKTFKSFSTHQMARIVKAMASLRYVNEATILEVIQQFLDEIQSIGLYFKPGLDGAMSILRDHLSDEVSDMLTSGRVIDEVEDPWVKITALDDKVLARILSRETPAASAVVLAKLPSGRAADTLGLLDPSVAQAVMMAAVKAGRIDPARVQDIGEAIATTAARLSDTGAFKGDPVARVGEILNFAPGATRNALLESLRAEDKNLAERLRKVMFTFADIPDRIEPKDVPKIARGVENATLITALAAGQTGEKKTVDFIMGNLSKRLSEQLTEEIREVGEVKQKEADGAMNEIIQAIRDLESSGEIFLTIAEDSASGSGNGRPVASGRSAFASARFGPGKPASRGSVLGVGGNSGELAFVATPSAQRSSPLSGEPVRATAFRPLIWPSRPRRTGVPQGVSRLIVERDAAETGRTSPSFRAMASESGSSSRSSTARIRKGDWCRHVFRDRLQFDCGSLWRGPWPDQSDSGRTKAISPPRAPLWNSRLARTTPLRLSGRMNGSRAGSVSKAW